MVAMNRYFLISIIALVILFGEALFYSGSRYPDPGRINGDNGGLIDYPAPVPGNNDLSDQFTSGNSRFSQGSCTNDADCVATGCSGEVCSGNGEVVSTCEYSDSFPNAQGLTCGCVQEVCGWK